MAFTTYNTTRKSFIYNFFPLKEDEERSTTNSIAFGPSRMLVEIRDVYPPPELNPHHPWQIEKTLDHYEVASGKIIVSFNDTFEYILRYWNFFMAKHVTMFGRKISVVLWDVTNEKNPKKYEGNQVFFQMTPDEHYLLTCSEMMKDRNLKVDDHIGLYWESGESVLRIKLFSSSGR